MRDPTERFSDRVDDYVRYRPSYPQELVDLMRVEMGLRGIPPDPASVSPERGGQLLVKRFSLPSTGRAVSSRRLISASAGKGRPSLRSN